MTRHLAVKAFIVQEGKLLILRRSPDEHHGGKWDFPGGRLEGAEPPYDGLKREVMEEANLSISVGKPIHVSHFSREDGYFLTFIFFLCTLEYGTIKLSHEHDAYEWVTLERASELLPGHLQEVVMAYLKEQE